MATAAIEPAVHATMVVRISRANLYLSCEIYDAYLSGMQSVALLEREGQMMIVPLMSGSAGGLLLKLRNGHGDRVIHAQEFFREHGFVEDFEERTCSLVWNPQLAALTIADVPRVAPN